MVTRLKPAKVAEGATVLPDTRPNDLVPHDTIIYFAGQLAKSYAEQRKAQKAYQMVRKQFKNSGVTLRTFDLVESFSEQDDPEALLDFLREVQHIAAAFLMPVGTQFKMFEGPGSPLEAAERAEKEGYNRGLMGLSPDTQAYSPESALGQAHTKGWYAGQAKLAQKFEAHNEKVRQEEADKAAAAAAKKAKADERAAKKAAKDGEPAVPKTEDGDTVQ
jgi:ribosome modulation factor